MAAKTKTKKKAAAAKKDPTPVAAEGTKKKQPATAADVALAAKQPPSPYSADIGIKRNLADLLNDPELAVFLRANATAINEEGDVDVESALARLANFISRYEAAERISVSLENLRNGLKTDNVSFDNLGTAIAKFFAHLPKRSALRSDETLTTFLNSREVQRGIPKAVKTRNKNAKAKKGAATKTP
jgi:hypothetical protein